MSGMAEDDLTLLDRWSAGDKEAEHKTDGEIDDLVQKTFLACLKGRETFRRQSSFRTYLFAIARHVLFGYGRRRTTGPATLDFAEISVESLSTSVVTRVSKKQDRAALLAALRALPLDQQILLEMFYWEELERDQLAEVFDVNTATIGTRLFRARQALQGRLTAPSGVNGDNAEGFDDWAKGLGRDAAPK
ncbi:MAG: sigma-70 family RNA polymerase sigma factor [Deltaproteobacteria bacterium]|nr:MAG: sigma-70 family RNA polymerase sigma factor [Deltaproteobacteria bacterium]